MYPNLNFSSIPVNIAEAGPIDRLYGKTALEHSAFHLLDSTPSFFIISILMMTIMMMVVVSRIVTMIREAKENPSGGLRLLGRYPPTPP